MPSPWTNPVSKSVPFDNSTNGFTATDAQAAIEEAKTTALGTPRFCRTCVMNGTVSGGNYITPSELTPNRETFYATFTGYIEEISFSFDNLSADFDIEIYKNGKLAGNLISTLQIRNQNNRVLFSNQNISFVSGDYFYFKYIDQGTNAADMACDIWGRRTA